MVDDGGNGVAAENSHQHFRVGRRELYDLGWAEPMTKVAANFGVTDVAMKKCCVERDILVSGRGYWARRV